MNPVVRLRIGARLGAAIGTMILLMVGITVSGRLGLVAIDREIELVVHDRYAKVKLVTDIDDQVNLQARSARNLLLLDDAAERAREVEQIERSKARTNELYAGLESKVTTEQGKVLLDKVLAERNDFRASFATYEKEVQAGDMAAAKTFLIDRLRPQQLEYMHTLGQLIAFQEQLMEDSGAAAVAQLDQVSMMMIGTTVAGVLLAVVAGWLVTRSVTRPIGVVVGSLRAVAEGDLGVQVAVDRDDEIGELQRALRTTVVSLQRVVGEVRYGVDSVTTASAQIAAGNQDLSSRTEQQAASLQQTASSMEQLTGTVRKSADTARLASELAAGASQAAGRGGEVVDQMAGTMGEIADSSRRIADITGVIDGIAFQTNILALNAAVEAARAGEEGRGFAVVAGEVRTLAQRSAQAAREIKSLIGASVDKVEAGSRQATEAGQAMSRIVEQARRVDELIGEIAAAAREQSDGIAQVNQAVAQMDRVTQQNAALVEESAAAAGSLEAQAGRLSQSVAAFRLAAAATA